MRTQILTAAYLPQAIRQNLEHWYRHNQPAIISRCRTKSAIEEAVRETLSLFLNGNLEPSSILQPESHVDAATILGPDESFGQT